MENKLDLSSEYLERIKGFFNKIESNIEVWAYGSRVGGTSHSASDLDLVIRNCDNLMVPQKDFAGMIEKLKDLNIPILIDLMDWAIIPEGFHEKIEECYFKII